MTRPYHVKINDVDMTMMLDEEGAKLYPDAVPVEHDDEPEAETAVAHKARRPAKQAAPARKKP